MRIRRLHGRPESSDPERSSERRILERRTAGCCYPGFLAGRFANREPRTRDSRTYATVAHVTRRAVASLTLAAAVFTLTLAVRVHGISRHFAMLGDQIRDWDIALGPFRDLPLVGPATHVGGYTIGPAFYWILWAIRVTVGPWFDNLPHGGGIGQAIVQSAADVLLLVAIWRRTGSVWLATAAVTLIATAPHDLALAALVWNPTMGSALAKIATALVLLEWPFRSLSGVAVTTAVAWAAVHSYTGAIFATIGVFASIVAGLFGRGERTRALRSAVVIAIVVAALQIPYVLYRMSPRAGPAMGAVTGKRRSNPHRAGAARLRRQLERICGRVHLHPGRPLASAAMARLAADRLRHRRGREASSRSRTPLGDDRAADARRDWLCVLRRPFLRSLLLPLTDAGGRAHCRSWTDRHAVAESRPGGRRGARDRSTGGRSLARAIRGDVAAYAGVRSIARRLPTAGRARVFGPDRSHTVSPAPDGRPRVSVSDSGRTYRPIVARERSYRARRPGDDRIDTGARVTVREAGVASADE